MKKKKYRQACWDEPLLMELSEKGRVAYSLPKIDKNFEKNFPKDLVRGDEDFLPEVSEQELLQHFARLEQMNFGAAHGIYPHGSCTMKYNPVINEKIASNPKMLFSHPLLCEEVVQGNLEIMYLSEDMLSKITGMPAVTLQPGAGAHGEMLGMLIAKAYHKHNNQAQRCEVVIPDSAHGTNPASAEVMLGYTTIEVPSNEKGTIDLEALAASLDSEKTAAIMLTNPNTLGIFEKDIVKIGKMVHNSGSIVYIDGANLNGIMGVTRPSDWFNGPAILHLNLHKTFSTPHGGGGPGAGPICVTKELEPFLPVPRIEKNKNKYFLNFNKPNSIGKIKGYFGNFGVIVRACAYILSLGAEGLKKTCENAVLNANYLMKKIENISIPKEVEDGKWKVIKPYVLPHKGVHKHEFVLESKTASALDVCKRLLDSGVQAPIMYFPNIVHEALMIEPTESATKKTLDDFVEILEEIGKESVFEPEKLKNAPHNTAVRRIDEGKITRSMILTFEDYKREKVKS